MDLQYSTPNLIELKKDVRFSENWVQEKIAEDPSILGIGELVLRDRERGQPKAGRFDLLLQDVDSAQRYEVEVQLGAVDESHIIRTIEYWDIERKRYPQYDHCAVIVAERITSRFLNVISLFNGSIPLIAIQMQALQISKYCTLSFTTVLDQLVRGLDEEDVTVSPADRDYWIAKASENSLKLVDKVFEIFGTIHPQLTLRYTKVYVGMGMGNKAFNFLVFRPKKTHVLVEFKIPKSEEIDEKLENSDLVTLEYNSGWGLYRLRVNEEDLSRNIELVKWLAEKAYQLRVGE